MRSMRLPSSLKSLLPPSLPPFTSPDKITEMDTLSFFLSRLGEEGFKEIALLLCRDGGW